MAVCLLLAAGGRSLAQRNERVRMVRGVRGEFAMVLANSDVTGREAAQRARDDARRRAVEKVCGSRMSIWERMEISSAGETFNSTTLHQIDGEVVSFLVVDEGVRQSEVRPSEVIFYCVADVEVKRGVEPDPDFVARVDGLRSVYVAGDRLEFTVTPAADCWLKIFLFEESGRSYTLYPNAYDRSRQLRRNQPMAFPQAVDFIVEKCTERPTEVNRLIFLFTKSERPFLEAEPSREEVEKWMALIPNDEKYIVFTTVDIRAE